MQRSELPKIGQMVIYRTDGRNGLEYDLPAMVTVTRESHPGNYPDGSQNPLPVPETPWHVHLTVFTPGGFGTTIGEGTEEPASSEFKRASIFKPGSGTYVEWNVPHETITDDFARMEHPNRAWRQVL